MPALAGHFIGREFVSDHRVLETDWVRAHAAARVLVDLVVAGISARPARFYTTRGRIVMVAPRQPREEDASSIARPDFAKREVARRVERTRRSGRPIDLHGMGQWGLPPPDPRAEGVPFSYLPDLAWGPARRTWRPRSPVRHIFPPRRTWGSRQRARCSRAALWIGAWGLRPADRSRVGASSIRTGRAGRWEDGVYRLPTKI